MTTYKIIAHRGFSAVAPENTIASIRKAIQLDIDFIDIEIDVHLSKDYIPVVMHDDTFERVTSSKDVRYITELTLEEIKKLEVGSWHHASYLGELVPTLKEVLELDFRHCGLMIELKKSPHPSKKVIEEVLKVVRSEEVSYPLLFGSFDPDLLKEVHKQDPTLSLIYIVEEKELIHEFSCKKVAVWEKILSKDVIEELKAKHQEIWSFTVDSPNRAKELISQGVTGIITNNPRYVKDHL